MSAGSPRAGRARTALIAAAAVIAAVVALAWVLQATADKGDESPAGDSSPGYSISVRQGSEVLKEYDLAALRALPQTSVVVDGKEQTGPLLRSLLDDAGVDPAATVQVAGAGIRDEGRLTLTAAEVDRDVQLDFSDRGTAKVCSPWLDRGEWVRDVISIDAQ
jgi:hypothetical protein